MSRNDTKYLFTKCLEAAGIPTNQLEVRTERSEKQSVFLGDKLLGMYTPQYDRFKTIDGKIIHVIEGEQGEVLKALKDLYR